MKVAFYRQIYKKYSNSNFNKNPIRVSRAVPFGWTDRQDVTKLIVAFRNLAKAPEVLKDEGAPVACGLRRMKIVFRNAWLSILALSINFHTSV
jgi:hypothetical protein